MKKYKLLFYQTKEKKRPDMLAYTDEHYINKGAIKKFNFVSYNYEKNLFTLSFVFKYLEFDNFGISFISNFTKIRMNYIAKYFDKKLDFRPNRFYYPAYICYRMIKSYPSANMGNVLPKTIVYVHERFFCDFYPDQNTNEHWLDKMLKIRKYFKTVKIKKILNNEEI